MATDRDDEPLVSIVLPVRDREGLVTAAIESVVTQSYDRFELIVVDDGSEDRSADAVRALRDARVKLVVLGQPNGAAAARNRGLAQAKGSIFAFIDSDSLWSPGRLGMHVAAMAAAPPDTGVVFGDSVLEDDTGRVLHRLPHVADRPVNGSASAVLAAYNVVDLPASLVLAEAFRSVGGFDDRLPRYQDWDLFIRLSARWRFEFVPGVAVRSIDASDRISRDMDHHYEALELLVRKHAGFYAHHGVEHVAYRIQLARHAARRRSPRRLLRHLSMAATRPGSLARYASRHLRGVNPLLRPE